MKGIIKQIREMPLGEGVGKARARIIMEAVMVKNLHGED
jgi:hypothetical protein